MSWRDEEDRCIWVYKVQVSAARPVAVCKGELGCGEGEGKGVGKGEGKGWAAIRVWIHVHAQGHDYIF